LVAYRQTRKKRQGNCRDARRGEHGARRPLQFGDQRFQSIGQRCALPAVTVAEGVVVKRVEGGENDRTAPVGGRIDEPVLGFGRSSAMGQQSLPAAFWPGILIVVGHITPPILTRNRSALLLLN